MMDNPSDIDALFIRQRQRRAEAETAAVAQPQPPSESPSEGSANESEATKGNLAYRLAVWASGKFTGYPGLDGRMYYARGRSLIGMAADSDAFADALMGIARKYNQAPSASTLKDAVRSMVAGTKITRAAMGWHSTVPVWMRAAKVGAGHYALLLRPPQGKDDTPYAVTIRPGAWEYLTPDSHAAHGVLFAPPAHALPMPQPVMSGRGLEGLWGVTNIAEADLVYVAAWLLAAGMPGEPCPILELTGGQGSGKSTTQAFLRTLVDPVNSALRAPPKNEDDLIAAAAGNWVLSFENVSHLTDGMQDALCRIVTGGAYAKRQLYTDSTEHIVNVQRPIILNSIVPVLTRPDAVDRTVRISLPRRSETVSAASLEASFKRSQGAILGGLLDLFAAVLAKLPSIHIPPAKQPRMIEYARICMSVAEIWGQDSESVLDGLLARRKAADSDTVEGSPVVVALLTLLQKHAEDVIEYGSNELRAQLASYRPDFTQGWPQSDKGLSEALTRYTEPLRRLGVGIERTRSRTARGYRFTKTPEFGT